MVVAIALQLAARVRVGVFSTRPPSRRTLQAVSIGCVPKGSLIREARRVSRRFAPYW